MCLNYDVKYGVTWANAVQAEALILRESVTPRLSNTRAL